MSTNNPSSFPPPPAGGTNQTIPSTTMTPVGAPIPGSGTAANSANTATPSNQGITFTPPPMNAIIQQIPIVGTLDLSAAQTIQQNQAAYTYLSGSITPRGQEITVNRLADLSTADDKRYVLQVTITNTNADIVQGDLASPPVSTRYGSNAPSSAGGSGSSPRSALQAQSASYFAIDSTVQPFDVNIAPTATLHATEIASLNAALDFLTSTSNAHAVALDVLERDNAGNISSPPQTHAVVLWKNSHTVPAIITLIDPSKTAFSLSLLDHLTGPNTPVRSATVAGSIVTGNVLYGSGGKTIGLVTDANLLQSAQPVSLPNLSLNARDCIDIAIKLIYEIEIQEAKPSSNAPDMPSIIKTITNQVKAYQGGTPTTLSAKQLLPELLHPEAQNSVPDIRNHEAQRRTTVSSAAAPKQSAKGKRTAATASSAPATQGAVPSSNTANASSAPGAAAPSGTAAKIPPGA